ncbi:hypothetical protein Tsubulata_027782 [Turnera subulata]|uniref:RING-type E3 ubiquitin transferase n=1 Tax=Turnera subulata TaxID=218843 RepID=A0A9Q0G0B2_9ROSI|nr:hypothetical protein Tsubulata_027782 [Turnera subulata]
MQGQRGIVGSFPETLEFDHGSASADIVDPQICWNSMRNPSENRLADFVLSPSHINSTYMNPIDHERQNLTGWNLGEPSSSRAQVEINHDEPKLEHGWSSSTSASSIVGSRLTERREEPANILSLDGVDVNPQSVQGSNAEAGPRNLNLNAGFAGHDGGQVLEGSNVYKNGVDNSRVPPPNGSDSLLLPLGSGGYLEENDGRPGCSLGPRRQSCKRKAVEGNSGQSSMDGSSSFFQRPESSSWPRVPARYVPGGNLSISAPSEALTPRLGLGMRGPPAESVVDSAFAGRAESSHRNFRLRINPSNQESVPLPPFSSGSAVRRPSPSLSSSRWSSRPLQVDHSLDIRSSLGIDSQNPVPAVNTVPALPHEIMSSRWNGSSSLRIGSSSNPINLSDGEDSNLGSRARGLWEHPMFVPATDLRNSARNSTNKNLTNGNTSGPGNVASTSRSGSSSGAHPSLAPTWVPHQNPPSRNSRRLAEYVRRSLFSSANAESGGPSSVQPAMPSGPSASTEETVIPSGTGSQTTHRSYPRLASWMERQVDGVLGIPYPLRTLSAGGEGRSRLVVSEHIRNVLDLMRRGESLRFEDVMILDQSLLFGAADIHDRHRDMRLDVDNMSYEELLALEERIGNVSTGLSEEAILSRLKQRKCSIAAVAAAAAAAEVEAEPCCICQEEYKDGEDLGTLDCGHDFHTHCIKQWLMHKNWCPICKTTGLAT